MFALDARMKCEFFAYFIHISKDLIGINGIFIKFSNNILAEKNTN